jgi:phosphate/sulfate permease
VTPSLSVAVAVVFVWLGMVLGISFLEAPLKFRAPEVTVRIGLGIGRLVFRALNTAEVVLAVTLLIAAWLGDPPARTMIASVSVVAVLAVQLILVRPGLTRRSDLILAGQDAPHAPGHLVYIGLEVLKVIILITTGILLLAS